MEAGGLVVKGALNKYRERESESERESERERLFRTLRVSRQKTEQKSYTQITLNQDKHTAPGPEVRPGQQR